MTETRISLQNNSSAPPKVAAVEGKTLSDNARFAISQYLTRLEKDRFFVDCTATGKSPEEAEQAWQASHNKGKAQSAGKMDSSIAKGMAAGVFAGVRK